MCGRPYSLFRLPNKTYRKFLNSVGPTISYEDRPTAVNV